MSRGLSLWPANPARQPLVFICLYPVSPYSRYRSWYWRRELPLGGSSGSTGKMAAGLDPKGRAQVGASLYIVFAYIRG